ncbi:PadR family transcriptional regulator [Phytohabitans aurantiacus]|nr:helix-turn-helix transcriptional regulator [Phytohabitans aurantiacus]
MEDIRLTSTTVLVLQVLYEQHVVYGLQVARDTKLMTGTVYPILTRLERAGWVASEWEAGDDADDDRGARRRFYRLTPPAREHVSELLAKRTREQERAQERAARLRPIPGVQP